MSISDCIDAYLSLSDRVFQKKAHRVSLKGKIQGRFDSQELEQAVKDVIAKQGIGQDAAGVGQSGFHGHGGIGEHGRIGTIRWVGHRILLVTLYAFVTS